MQPSRDSETLSEEQGQSQKILQLTRFGNPILRQVARVLTVTEIRSDEMQQLIANIRHTNKVKECEEKLHATFTR